MSDGKGAAKEKTEKIAWMKKITALLRKVQYNSPVVLTFALVSFVVFLLSLLTSDSVLGTAGSWTNTYFFSVYRSAANDPLTYVRLFGHVLGHSGLEHYFGNFILILLIGPMMEEKYGSRNMLLMILFTAALIGLIHMIFVPNVMLLGASGIVFMLMLLSSYTNMQKDRIPLTLILCIAVFLGRELTNGIFYSNSVSSLAHIIGGGCGAVFGYFLNRSKLRKNEITAEERLEE